MKIAAAYIRVSTEDQVEYSPDSQLKLIREYTKKHDLVLPEELIFVDEGISGKSAQKRPAFNRMIAIAKQKENSFDVILVWKFSRFARNQEESIVYKNLLKKSNVEVVSISEPMIDGVFGSLVERIIEWMDEYYVIRLSDEVRRGMTEKATRGEPMCHPAFGYTMRDKQYYPNEAEAPFVKEIFNRYLESANIKEIAIYLQDCGIKTQRGNPPDRRFVEYILHNPVYTGKIRWCTEGRAASARDYNNPNMLIVEGHHEALISQEVFDKAQLIYEENSKRFRKYQRDAQPVEWMLKGLLRCGTCGGTLVATSRDSLAGAQCHNYNGLRGCRVSHYISIRKANAIVIEELKKACSAQIFKIAPETLPKENIDTSLEYARLLKREEEKLLKVKEAFEAGIDTLEEYRDNKGRISKKIEALKLEYEKARLPKQKPQDIAAYTARVRTVISIIENPTESEKAKNEALRSILTKIVFNVNGDIRTLDLYFYM